MSRHSKKKRKVVVASDMHCGHHLGLTPPKWWSNDERLRAIQEQAWDCFLKHVEDCGPIDVLVLNGDMIDGKGQASGGTELITTDRLEQCEIAAVCIQEFNAKKIMMTKGTPYHTGKDEDFEVALARAIDADFIGNRLFLEVNGVNFDVRHHINASSTLAGRPGTIARTQLWNELWNVREMQPRADIIIRSHVHYYTEAGGVDWWGCTTPALQGVGSKFGELKCDGLVDWGFLSFVVHRDGRWEKTLHTERLSKQQARTLVV